MKVVGLIVKLSGATKALQQWHFLQRRTTPASAARTTQPADQQSNRYKMRVNRFSVTLRAYLNESGVPPAKGRGVCIQNKYNDEGQKR